MTAAVSVDCPAKVNLFLRILAREDSGYHQIETFFLAVGLYDRVTVAAGDEGIAFSVEPPHKALEAAVAPEAGADARSAAVSAPPDSLGPPERNTVYRAARAFYAAAGLPPAAAVSLKKGIPPGTGLGGASSDAAGTLAALNFFHGEPLSRGQLLAAGRSIGADVPFFCSGEPAALAWGRGDRLLPCAPPEAASVVIAIPRERAPTAGAYASVSETLSLPARPAVLSAVARGDWGAVARTRGNDFESDRFRRTPVLAEACATLRREGAVLAGLTGSGSAVFGLFANGEAAACARSRVEPLEDIDDALVVPALARPWLPKNVAAVGRAPGLSPLSARR